MHRFLIISARTCFDHLCVVKDFFFLPFEIRVFVIISGIPTRTHFFGCGSVPILLMEHVGANDLNSSAAVNVLAWQ